MSIINTVKPEEAEGEIKAMYDLMLENAGIVPAPMQLASASPGMFGMLAKSIGYYSEHPTLGFGLLSAIRFLTAQASDFAFCTGFNKGFLMKQGMTAEDIEKMSDDPSQVPLEDKERELLAFVIKAVKNPETASKEDMERLHEKGWTDRDILDAMAHAANMVASALLMKTFKMDQTC